MNRTYQIKIEIPGLPKLPNQLLGAHWRTRSGHAKAWQRHVYFAFRAGSDFFPKEPLKKARLILTRKSSQEPDSDGLVGSFKCVVDGLVKAGVITDDKPSVIGIPEYRWTKAKAKQGSICIEVESIKELNE